MKTGPIMPGPVGPRPRVTPWIVIMYMYYSAHNTVLFVPAISFKFVQGKTVARLSRGQIACVTRNLYQITHPTSTGHQIVTNTLSTNMQVEVRVLSKLIASLINQHLPTKQVSSLPLFAAVCIYVWQYHPFQQWRSEGGAALGRERHSAIYYVEFLQSSLSFYFSKKISRSLRSKV